MSSDEFSGPVSDDSYDPRRVWFSTRDSKPPYDKTSIRMYYPTWFLQEVNRFVRDDPSKSFTSAQQVLHNAEYHGFHHMDAQGFQADELIRNAALMNDMEELASIHAAQNGLLRSVDDAMRSAETTAQRAAVTAKVRAAILQTSDAELVEKLRRYLT